MASRKEMEERLHACDPYEGGRSMADAALERIAAKEERAKVKKPSAEAVAAVAALTHRGDTTLALALDAFAEAERERIAVWAAQHYNPRVAARIRARGTQGGEG